MQFLEGVVGMLRGTSNRPESKPPQFSQVVEGQLSQNNGYALVDWPKAARAQKLAEIPPELKVLLLNSPKVTPEDPEPQDEKAFIYDPEWIEMAAVPKQGGTQADLETKGWHVLDQDDRYILYK